MDVRSAVWLWVIIQDFLHEGLTDGVNERSRSGSGFVIHPVAALLAFDACFSHVNDDRASRLDDIAIDDRTILDELFCCEASLVDNLHLFNDGTLS